MAIELKNLIDEACQRFERNFSAGDAAKSGCRRTSGGGSTCTLSTVVSGSKVTTIKTIENGRMPTSF